MQSIPGDTLDLAGRPMSGPQPPPRPRAWSENPEAAYRELFDATEGTVIPDDEPPAPQSPRSRRNRRIAAVVALLLVLGAIGGAWAWRVHASKQPALNALRVGNAEFEPVATKLRSAEDMDELRTAAGRAGAAADRIEDAARPLASPSSNLERGVRDVLRDEAAVLHATASVSTLEIESLGGWPDVRDEIAGAESDLAAAAKRLASVEPDLAASLLTNRALAQHGDEVVADFAATSMTDLLVSKLSELGDARTTADVRAVATGNASSNEVVGLALKGVDAEGPQGKQITQVGAALKALSGLGAINADHLAAWAGVRAQLVAATTGLEGVDNRNALSAVDGLVARGQQALSTWKATTARLRAKSQKDTRALTTYSTAVQNALTREDAADKAAAAFVTTVNKNPEITSQQAIAYLDAAKKTRTAIATALARATPPKRLRKQHQALVAAVQAAAAPVADGYQGTKKTKCGKLPSSTPGGAPTPAPCYYNKTGGWTAFSSGTAQASEALAAARTAWDEAIAAAQKAIAARKLPAKPVL